MNNSTKQYDPVDASPVKSFFVNMLTRDIRLEDAILDLLDNCVDGILRSSKKRGSKPYSGYKAEIEFGPQHFSILDNCGGIPVDLHDRAFKMGPPRDRSDDPAGTVGVYGIGMKRAIFKLGRHCLISSRNGDDQYEVKISPIWMRNEDAWQIPVQAADVDMSEDGTAIYIKELNPGIADTFGESGEKFEAELMQLIATHYAYIIEKGFEVTVNSNPVMPRTTKIVFADQGVNGSDVVRPFIFEAEVDGVEIYLAAGFTRPIPTENELMDEQEAARRSSVDAGWTILCNDRVVVYCDRSELTGWGEAGVPRYHTQFIAISGIVEFRSDDAGKLPTTTTKRGIDASSPLYLQIKNKMREGMRVFTDFTNKWKGSAEESEQHIERGTPLTLAELRTSANRLTFSATRTLPPGKRYTPKLPLPRRLEATKRRITFTKEIEKIQAVADYMGDPDMRPSNVGEACFDTYYVEVSR